MNQSDTDGQKESIRASDMRLIEKLPPDIVSKGGVIRDRRIALGLAQTDLALRADVSQRAISCAERQSGRQKTRTMAAIAAALDLRLDQVAFLNVSAFEITDRIDQALIEAIRLVHRDIAESGRPASDVRTFVDECCGIEDLRLYSELTTEEKDRLWFVAISRGWVMVDSSGRTAVNRSTLAPIQKAYPRQLMIVTDLYAMQALLCIRHRFLAPDALPEAQAAIDVIDFPTIATELDERIQSLTALPNSCSTREFSDRWCACDLVFTAGDAVTTNLIVHIHDQTKLTLEYLHLTPDNGETLVPFFKRLAIATTVEASRLLHQAILDDITPQQVKEWHLKFTNAATVMCGYITTPLLFESIHEEYREEVIKGCLEVSSDPVFTEEFRELQSDFYFSKFPRPASQADQ